MRILVLYKGLADAVRRAAYLKAYQYDGILRA